MVSEQGAQKAGPRPDLSLALEPFFLPIFPSLGEGVMAAPVSAGQLYLLEA